MENCLYCGAAREKITPPVEWLRDLRGLMDSSFGGVVDDLYVRVVALENAGAKMLLFTFDLDKVPWPKEKMEELERQTGVPKENILLVSIHTHSAPISGDRPYEGPNYIARKPENVQKMTKKYEKFLEEKMLSAAKNSLKNMKPCVMRFGYGKSYVNVNRLGFYEVREKNGRVHRELGTGTNFEREADRTLFVMSFEDRNGKPVAFFVNYPVHNTVMILNACGKDGKVGISADLGGNVSKKLEAAYPGSVALWTSGAAGDLNPIMSNQVYREDFDTGKPVEIYEKDGAVPLSMLKTLTAHHFAEIQSVLRRMGEAIKETPLFAGEVWAEVPGKDEDGRDVPYKVRVHKLSIGPVALFGFSGELYSGLGKEIKAACGAENLILINHDASMLYNTGYIYNDEIFEMKEKYGGDVVGLDHTWLRPGYIAPELIRCVNSLLDSGKKLEGREPTCEEETR